jgi:hypothetical protein
MAPIDKFSGSTFTGITTLSGNTLTSISEVDDIAAPSLVQSGEIVRIYLHYDFEEEITAEGDWDNDVYWHPTSDMVGLDNGIPDNAISWRNHKTPIDIYGGGATLGIKNLTGTVQDFINPWGGIFTGTPVGWNLGQGSTPSSNTGPNGGAVSPIINDVLTAPFNENSGSIDTSGRYIYAEGTPGGADAQNKHHICAFNFNNALTTMIDTNNDLQLRFFMHGDGGHIGVLKIYAVHFSSFNSLIFDEDNDAFFEAQPFSNHTNATTSPNSLLATFDFTTNAFGLEVPEEQTLGSDPYSEKIIDLNSLKTVEATNPNLVHHWIFFVYGALESSSTANFRSDLAIDNIIIQEVTP